MEQPPNQNLNTAEKQQRKFKATIVDATDLMRSQAEDIGNAKMTMEAPKNPEKLKGVKKFIQGEFWSRLGKKVWKHGIARDYFRNKEIYKASEEILKTKNVFTGEGKSKEDHDRVMTEIINQFTSEYEEAVHTEAGEKKLEIGKDEFEEEATGDKASVKQLIKDYATGKITEESFRAQEERLFHNLKGNVDDKEVKGNVMYASNLFEIAEQVKLAIKNKEFLENEDFELDVIYGKSKAGVRTDAEAHYTKTERIINKMMHSKVGQFTNETSFTIAASCIAALLVKSATNLPGKIVPIVGTAAISSYFAKRRAETEERNKWATHSRQMAKGETFDSETMQNRSLMETFRYQTESSTELLKNIDQNLEILKTKGDNLTEQELNTAFSGLSSLEAMIRLSDRRKIDLITYSDTTKVVKERLELDIKKRQLRDALQKEFEGGKIPNPTGQNFEDYFNSLSTAEENRMISEKDTGIDAKDRDFNKMKSKVGNKAAWTAFKTGILVGATVQELVAGVDGLWGGQRVGIVEDMVHQVKGGHSLAPGVGTEHLTTVAYLKHLVQGDVPKMDVGNIHETLIGQNHVKLPEGTHLIHDANGTCNLVGSDGKMLAEHLKTGADGTFTPEAEKILTNHGITLDKHLITETIQKPVGVEEYIKNHPGSMKDIHRLGWYDNDTQKFDLNELKTQWGGINGTGFDAKGNIVLSVEHMTADGSFHGNLSADALALMKAGHLKFLVSASDATQHNGFVYTVTPEGNIVIPPGDECAKLMFTNVNGHAVFNGRFGEIAQDMGNDGYKMLGTLEGKGLTEVMDTVTTSRIETNMIIPGNYDWVPPPYISVVPGNPLEKLNKKGAPKTKEKNKDIPPIVPIPVGEKEKDLSKDNTVVEYGSMDDSMVEKKTQTEEQKGITQEEYDAMKDDMKMLNKKRQSQEGIATITENDFKSEYGKKRYNELKHIGEGIPVTFNHEELLVIGDEIETILRNTKITKENSGGNVEASMDQNSLKGEKGNFDAKIKKSKEELEIASTNKEKVFTEFENFIKNNPTENIPKELEERNKEAEKYFNEIKKASAEMGTAFKKEREVFSEFEDFVNNSPEVPIPKTLEDRYRKAEERLVKAEKEWERILAEKENIIGKITPIETINETPVEKTTTKIEKPKEETSVETNVIEQKIQTPEIKTENEKSGDMGYESIKPSGERKISAENKFTVKDLSKVGTEFEIESGSFKITKLSGGFLSRKKVEGIFKDRVSGKETPISYYKNQLEKEFEEGRIEIRKAGK